MFAFSRRLIYALSNKVRTNIFASRQQDTESKLTVDFSKTQKSPFNIESESSYNACLSNGSLMLGLKKSNCIAWVEIPQTEYSDHVIEAKIRMDSLGAYVSTGIIFRIIDQDSYYLALVSSKGYFRLDVVKDSVPKTLIAWTEISEFDGININFNIITYGTYLIFIVNGKWAGETNDDSINSGRLGFVLASYATGDEEQETENNEYETENKKRYTCITYLDYISIDTRVKAIEDSFKKWTNDSNINADSRLRLAETFAVMGKYSKALDQIRKAWNRRDEAIGSVSVSYTQVRTKRELLLAARMSFALGQYQEAEEYIDSILEQWSDSAEGFIAHAEKLKVLNELNKFEELKEFVLKHPDTLDKDIDYYTITARMFWELKEYENSAEAWEKAFRMTSEEADANAGIYAANAANALESAGKKKEALALFLEAGKVFLKQDNKSELEAINPRLSLLGKKNWEARAFTGKWAFSIEDYNHCAAEFAAAEKLRCALKPRPKADPAIYYLWGLIFYLKGKNKTAISLLKKAVKLAPDYDLFREKLEEIMKIG
jgi:tetratricopeptide (TPR) repeat protein